MLIRPTPCRFAAGMLLMLVLGSAPGARAQSPDACAEALEQAEERYVEAEYDAAMQQLAPCLNRTDLPESQTVAVYRLLTLSHIKKGELEDAKLAVVELLDRVPGYVPDPVIDLPAYVSLVQLVRDQVQLAITPGPPEETAEPLPDLRVEERQRSWFEANRSWLIAGGVAVGVVTGLVLSAGGGGGGSSALPLPPAMP